MKNIRVYLPSDWFNFSLNYKHLARDSIWINLLGYTQLLYLSAPPNSGGNWADIFRHLRQLFYLRFWNQIIFHPLSYVRQRRLFNKKKSWSRIHWEHFLKFRFIQRRWPLIVIVYQKNLTFDKINIPTYWRSTLLYIAKGNSLYVYVYIVTGKIKIKLVLVLECLIIQKKLNFVSLNSIVTTTTYLSSSNALWNGKCNWWPIISDFSVAFHFVGNFYWLNKCEWEKIPNFHRESINHVIV